MARLLPYYLELKEKFNQDRIQGLNFKALNLFVLHFLRDRSIFAIFGLEDLYQAGTLTEVHFRDFDSWDWDYSMSKDLDCLDEIVNELHECGELDDLDEPDEQDEEEPCHPVALMHEDIQFELRWLIRRGDLEAVKRVLDMTPEIVDAWALCIAIETHKTDILCQLLEHGAQVDEDVLHHPLCDAAKYGNKDIVQLLLSRGADIEGGNCGKTPLIHAARGGHFEIVQYLVEQGADVNATWVECPLFYAIENGHTHIVEYLLASGANVFGDRGQYCRSKKWYKDSFKSLVANCCARSRYLLLSKAAADGDLDLVEYLVSFGVDVNSTGKKSPLYRATENRQSETVCFLLGHATDVQPADVSDLLWCAAENDDLNTIYLLLGCGPRLHLRLLNKLLSVTGSSGRYYRIKAAGNVHDGFFIRLPKDEILAKLDSRVSNSRDLGVKLLGARQS